MKCTHYFLFMRQQPDRVSIKDKWILETINNPSETAIQSDGRIRKCGTSKRPGNTLDDINIGNKIIVETKALGQNLDIHVQQLSDYCGREWPVLAMLTNGRNFRIYSPQWRHQRTFPEKMIYVFDIRDLGNVQLLNRLEKILGMRNCQSGAFLDHIEQREKEILKAKREIDDLKQSKAVEVSVLRTALSGLKEKLHELTTQIKLKEQAIAENES